MRKVAIFDFDKTLTITDTTKIWVLAFLLVYPLKSLHIIHFIAFSQRRNKNRNSIKDDLLFSIIRHCDQRKLAKVDQLFCVIVKVFLNRKTLEELRKSKLRNDITIVVTASIESAVSMVLKQYTDLIIGTKITFDDVSHKATKVGEPCFGREKVNRLHELGFLDKNCFKVTECWSDSNHDDPIMLLSKKRFWVVKSRSKYHPKSLSSKDIFFYW